MNSLHARYPFLTSSREAVRDANLVLAEVIAGEGDRHPAVERGVERVRRALLDGTVRSPADGPRWGVTAEVLSYPIARMLVSLLDAPGAVEKYASAEAGTAYEQFVGDFESSDDGLKSTQGTSLTLESLLSDFDLSGSVTRREDDFGVAVGTYLSLVGDFPGDDWRLVSRRLSDGVVGVSQAELHELLRAAAEERIASDLPLSVPEEIADALSAEVAELESSFTDADFSHDIDTLAPGFFPPCMKALLTDMRDGKSLAPASEFSLVSFLASIGLDADEVLALCEVRDSSRADRLRYRVERVRDERSAQFAPPSCATLDAYGDCVNKDDRCETITHPLVYYEDALDENGAVTDWRDR
ncbi:DNA primase large subunit PriL [Haladaptatus cibarius]|uniref:DNA primase large subunit PriL n=1 Tax=Haladaptatus cibarius TaxID=453847 RepID=UPI000679C8D1|nr:DNA primase large subunit PriL [Haladaptatus cibarius]